MRWILVLVAVAWCIHAKEPHGDHAGSFHHEPKTHSSDHAGSFNHQGGRPHSGDHAGGFQHGWEPLPPHADDHAGAFQHQQPSHSSDHIGGFHHRGGPHPMDHAGGFQHGFEPQPEVPHGGDHAGGFNHGGNQHFNDHAGGWNHNDEQPHFNDHAGGWNHDNQPHDDDHAGGWNHGDDQPHHNDHAGGWHHDQRQHTDDHAGGWHHDEGRHSNDHAGGWQHPHEGDHAGGWTHGSDSEPEGHHEDHAGGFHHHPQERSLDHAGGWHHDRPHPSDHAGAFHHQELPNFPDSPSYDNPDYDNEEPQPQPTLDIVGDAAPQNEDDIIAQIVQIFSDSTNQLAQDNSPWLRQAHVKQHACLRATLAITNSDPDFQSGVFVNGASYPVFIRWSNGAGPGFATGFSGPRNDALPDNRAIAIKLLNVPGTKVLDVESDADTQDFLFTTSQAAFLTDAAQSLAFFTATAGGFLQQSAWLTTHPSTAKLYALDTPAAGLVKDLSTTNFYTNVPQMFANTYAKFMLAPCDNNPSQFTVPGQFWYYRDRFTKDMNAGDVCYSIQVQLYQDDATTPIEDGTAVWQTAWTELGTLTIPGNQQWGSDGQEEFCENLSFNPWHSLPDHEPVGGIQRVRKAVYTTMGQLRAQIGGFAFAEPTQDDYDNFVNL